MKFNYPTILSTLFLYCAVFSHFAQAQITATNQIANVTVPLSQSSTAPAKLAPWQESLTLGPGDNLGIGLLGQPATFTEMPVGPDGRINYLEARDVMAAGMTVDQLRSHLEGKLGEIYLSARVVVYPLAYRSKKYYVLGNVSQKGVFYLDRPTTLVEAVAKAKGFLTGGESRFLQTEVNFGHSFLIRKSTNGVFTKVPLDLEALFLQGDLKNNQLLEPDDYLFFAPLGRQDIFVLGEVLGPGAALYTPGMGTLQAIAKRGGFTEAAYRSKILVVRGSLTRPESFVISGKEILDARSTDFQLQPGDIIYVSRKPWSKAEELLDIATSSFFRAAVITWTGNNVGPLIESPIID